MILETGARAAVPLPEFSQPMALAGARDEIGFRRFGVFEQDLDVDFSTPNRAALGTRLLNQCVVDGRGSLPTGFFEELSVGKRIECLLFLATGSTSANLGFPFKCAGCGEELELELSLDEISSLQRTADATDVIDVSVGDRRIELRKSSGRDQSAWFGEVYSDEYDATARMITRLMTSPVDIAKLGPEALDAIDAAMDESDPLVNFSCGVDCLECGTANVHDVDLFEAALAMLEREQQQAVVMVHRLASRYHWSEREIFAIPARRREQYLELIGAKG